MKVCLDLRYRTESGAAVYIKNITENLLKSAGDIRYVLLKYEEQRFGFEDLAHEVIVAPNLPVALDVIWTLIWLPFLLKRKGIDVHHAFKWPIPYWCSASTVTTMHSAQGKYKGEEHFEALPMQLYYWFYGDRMLRKASAVVAVSKFMQECLIEQHGVRAENVRVIYPGIHDRFRRLPDESVAPVLKKYGLKRDYIICVGNVVVVKNHYTVVKALAEIAGEVSADLVIVGATEHRNSDFQRVMNAVSESGLKDRVKFLGFVGREDVPSLYNGSAVMVASSLSEGFGIALVEAFKCGIPVIASHIGPFIETGTGRALMLMNPKNHKELARHLKAVLTSADLRKALSQRSEDGANEYSWPKCAMQHHALYRQICENRKNGRPVGAA